MLKTDVPSESKRFDVLIIGAGPAGLTAAIYAARAQMKVGFIEGSVIGGKMTATDNIANYPGFDQIAGADLAMHIYNQAANLKAQYIYGWVSKIEKDETRKIFCVSTADNNQYFAKVVIVATGMKERKLNLPDEQKFENKGLSYCAVCDGGLYKNKDVAVIGGGNSAIQEGLYLTKLASKVYIIHRRDEFRADAVMMEEIKKRPNVEFLTPYSPVQYLGTDRISGLKVKNLNTNEEKDINVACIFPYIGFNPSTSFVADLGILNPQTKQIITDKNKETSIIGLYAVGDCTEQNFRQITTANSDGTVAALHAIDYINANAKNWNW